MTTITPWRPWLVCAVLLMATALSYLDRQALSVVAPLVREELKLDNAQLGLLLSAFFYSYAAMHLFVGAILDRFNIRYVYAAFVAAWSLAQACTGIAIALFDVLVLPNQYVDILPDLAARLVGNLGLVPGVNIGPGVAVFEAAHGAAPDIAGKGVANPIGLILSGAMLLDYLAQPEPAERVRRAVAKVLAVGRCLTPDFGGHSSTWELTRAICAEIESA